MCNDRTIQNVLKCTTVESIYKSHIVDMRTNAMRFVGSVVTFV